jgi:membrane protein implicated in regulation of membrane protease activity
VGHGAAHAPGARGAQFSFFNPVTAAAFLTWFGGTGFLLTRFSRVWFSLGLLIAFVSGLVGSALVFLFLTRVLMADHQQLDPADYDMVGVLGRISMPIRQSGTGELIYSQAGTRRSCGARAEDDVAIEKGTEVIVTRYEKGIAYVRPWTEMAGEEPELTQERPAQEGKLSS